MQNIVPKICKKITGNFYTLYFKDLTFLETPILASRGKVECVFYKLM